MLFKLSLIHIIHSIIDALLVASSPLISTFMEMLMMSETAHCWTYGIHQVSHIVRILIVADHAWNHCVKHTWSHFTLAKNLLTFLKLPFLFLMSNLSGQLSVAQYVSSLSKLGFNWAWQLWPSFCRSWLILALRQLHCKLQLSLLFLPSEQPLSFYVSISQSMSFLQRLHRLFRWLSCRSLRIRNCCLSDSTAILILIRTSCCCTTWLILFWSHWLVWCVSILIAIILIIIDHNDLALRHISILHSNIPVSSLPLHSSLRPTFNLLRYLMVVQVTWKLLKISEHLATLLTLKLLLRILKCWPCIQRLSQLTTWVHDHLIKFALITDVITSEGLDQDFITSWTIDCLGQIRVCHEVIRWPSLLLDWW